MTGMIRMGMARLIEGRHGLRIASLGLIAALGCRYQGSFVEPEPRAWSEQPGRIHVQVQGTFGEHARYRLPVPEGLHLEFIYWTTAPIDAKMSESLSQSTDVELAMVAQGQELHDLIAAEHSLVISAFSQGTCVALDLISRLADAELERVEWVVLLSPAFRVDWAWRASKRGYPRRMEQHCAQAQAKLLDAMAARPALAKLVRERMVIAEVERDRIVEPGHDALPVSHRFMLGTGHSSWLIPGQRGRYELGKYLDFIAEIDALMTAAATATAPPASG